MITTIVTFFVVLGLLIFVHELGHFIAAKKFKVGVEEFGFGFPPRVIGLRRKITKEIRKVSEKETISLELDEYKNEDGNEVIKETVTDQIKEIDREVTIKKWKIFTGKNIPDQNEQNKETVYSLNLIPVGGFVKIKGEQGEGANEQDSFASKKIWKRSIILGSGVMMNFVLAIILLAVGFAVGIPSVLGERTVAANNARDKKIQVVSILPDSPADKSGFQIGDAVEKINDQQFNSIEELQKFNYDRANQIVNVTLIRGKETIKKEITLQVIDNAPGGKMGAGLVETGIISYPWYSAIWEGTKAVFYLTWEIIAAFYGLLKNLILTQKVSSDLTGPVGIAVMTSQVSRMGFIYVLQFTALLSINLAIINILPFPALDGGRILFLVIEKLRKKAINQKIEAIIHNIGFALLMVLVLLVTFRDVSKFKDSIVNFLKHVIS